MHSIQTDQMQHIHFSQQILGRTKNVHEEVSSDDWAAAHSITLSLR
jgi:hypothetical protein